MLFLDTCVVKASDYGYSVADNFNFSFTFTIYPDNFENIQDVTYDSGSVDTDGTISYSGSSVGTTNPNTGYTNTTQTGSSSADLSGSFESRGTITVANGVKYFNTDLVFYTRPYNDDYLISKFGSEKDFPYIETAIWSGSMTSSVGTLINNEWLVNDRDISDNNPIFIDKRAVDYYKNGKLYYTPRIKHKAHFTYALGNQSDFTSPLTFTVNLSERLFVRENVASIVAGQGTPVVDYGVNNELKDLNESTEAIEQSVTSDTGGGILATIKNFFGSFFQNVFDTLVSVFVPEDGFFSDWFDRLNTLLSEKLGMLYAPFDLLITTLNAIMNADTTDTGIPFPGIQWEDTYLVEPFTFYFSSLGDTFTDLQGYVYFATDTVLLFAFLYLLQNKIRLILEGYESG